ncbi:hypothetical protein [uncultured Eubacterium sp.]|uniref:hypothetical protein n=1 Tax=uncultured Eubacterium sp. TaxID=165185 RepID=UPI003265FB03
MNVISKKKQGIIAIICAIAMVVTSLTIYNPREAKADTDYSQLTYDYKNKGESYMKGAETTKSKWRVAVDTSQSTGDIVNWMTKGDGNLNFYGEMFMNVTWHGVYPDATLEINGVKVEEGAEGVQAYASAEIHVNAKTWINNNAYNVVKVTSKDETQYVTFIVATGNKVDTSTEESTELQKPVAPTGLVANINDLKTNYTIAFANVATATSYRFYLDDKYVKDITNGGIVTIEELNLEVGKTYTFGVSAVNAAGESAISTVSVTVPSKETETTTGSEETTETLDPSTIKDWTEVTNSNKTMLYYIANKASDKVSVKPEMHGDNLYAAFTLAAKFKSVELNGETIKPREGADIEIPKTSFSKEYNKLVVTNYYGSETVTIYFKVVSATEKTKYKVTVDGTPTEVEEGSTYTFGDNAQGYYDKTNSVAYASGEKITVNSDITVTSIKLNVAMQKGASVRLATPTGLRFQTVITSGNDIAASDILNKDFVTTGTLITTFDLFSANGNVLNKDSKYTNLDIANSGWYNDEVGKFCGSIIKIKTGNYEKKFVGVGYATITYHNGDKYSIYADVNETDNARSIYYVANAVKEAGYKNCDAAQKAIIDKYLAKEAF